VALGIATAYERYYGVLKRLGASPLPRAGLITAKALSVLALEVVQVALLMIVAAIFYGWHPAGSIGTLLIALLLGSITFAALGLAMAGALRAEATLAGANGLYLLFLLLSDAVLPLDHLPTVLQDLAHVLPAAALTDALRAALTAGAAFPGSDIAVLAVWAIIVLGVAMRTFKWE
jgi:ABC-2 type transport system permease protein